MNGNNEKNSFDCVTSGFEYSFILTVYSYAIFYFCRFIRTFFFALHLYLFHSFTVCWLVRSSFASFQPKFNGMIRIRDVAFKQINYSFFYFSSVFCLFLPRFHFISSSIRPIECEMHQFWLNFFFCSFQLSSGITNHIWCYWMQKKKEQNEEKKVNESSVEPNGIPNISKRRGEKSS